MDRFSPLPTLTTERLRLRALKPEDAKAIYDYQSDKSHFPHVDMAVYTAFSEAEVYIERMNSGVAAGKWIIWAIADQTDDRILGTLSIWNFDWEKRIAEFGYGLFPEARGKGYMREALAAARAYGFNVLKLDALEAYTAIVNKPSIQLLENQGFDFLDEIDEEGSSGALTHMAVYRVTRRS